MIDLHTHTTASDGTLAFEELISEARRVGLKAIAITDHDNIKSAKKITGNEAIQAIPGIELSIFDKELGYADIHMLGLYLDPQNTRLNKKLDSLALERENQKRTTVEKLCELGYDITFEEVKAKTKGVVGRPHIAKVLIEKYPEQFHSIPEVFSKLLGRGKPAYLERETGFGLKEAIELVRVSGGLSFIAHPLLYPYDVAKLLNDFKKLGGHGLEVYYDYITNRPEAKLTEKENMEMVKRCKKLAADFDLLESGGSDFHGATKGQTLGKFGAPDELLEKMKHCCFENKK